MLWSNFWCIKTKQAKRSATKLTAGEGFHTTYSMHKHYSDYSYPWKVPSILSPCRIMLDSIQHQIQWEHSHTEYGPSTHCHLFPQLHPPLERSSFRIKKKIKMTLTEAFFSPSTEKKKSPWVNLNAIPHNADKMMGSKQLHQYWRFGATHAMPPASIHHTGDHSEAGYGSRGSGQGY